MRKHPFFGAAVALFFLVSTLLATPAAAQKNALLFPDVVGAKAQARGDNAFDFDVTVSSPYDSAQRYADGFRVRSASGTVYGERKLVHDHAGEQPFTRDLYGVKIPPAVKRVTIEARDQQSGYGGKTFELRLPGR